MLDASTPWHRNQRWITWAEAHNYSFNRGHSLQKKSLELKRVIYYCNSSCFNFMFAIWKPPHHSLSRLSIPRIDSFLYNSYHLRTSDLCCPSSEEHTDLLGLPCLCSDNNYSVFIFSRSPPNSEKLEKYVLYEFSLKYTLTLLQTL